MVGIRSQAENSENSEILGALTMVKCRLPSRLCEMECLELCRQTGSREIAECCACQCTDCLIQPIRTLLIQEGLVQVLLFPRGEIMLPI